MGGALVPRRYYIYPDIGLVAPIMGVLIGVSIAIFLTTAWHGLLTLNRALRSDSKTAWAAYGAKIKKLLVALLVMSSGAILTRAYQWLVYGF